MEPRFTPHAHTLATLFNDRWPMYTEHYQRDYAWEADEIRSFVGDLRSIFAKRGETGADPVRHFFGALVAIQHPRTDYLRPKYEIVDGQQRLATFSLSVATLVHGVEMLLPRLDTEQRVTAEKFIAGQKAAFVEGEETNQKTWRDESVPVFSMTDRDDRVFRDVLQGGDLDAIDIEGRGSHRLLVDAARLLRKELLTPPIIVADPVRSLQNLLDFRTAIAEGSEFVFIWTKSSQDAHQLFSVLNDRGRRLEQADLLRVYTLMLANNASRAVQDRIVRDWDTIDSASRGVVDGFLRHYYASVFGERVASDSTYKRYRERFFGDSDEPVGADADWVADRVGEFASAMTKHYEPISKGEWPFDEPNNAHATPKWTVEQLGRLVRVLGSDRVLPLLLSAATTGRKDFGRLVKEMTRIEFRALVTGVEQNKVANAYMDVAALLRAGVLTVGQAVGELDAWVTRWADDMAFADGMRGLRYGSSRSNAYIKHLLMTVDDHLASPEGPVTHKMARQPLKVWDYGPLQDEHIYPQAPVGGVPQEMRHHVHRLGNQTLLSDKDNPAKEFTNRLPEDSDKINGYIAAEPSITRRVGLALRGRPVWSVPEVDAREEWLIQAVVDVMQPSAEVKARAAGLPATRERVYRWRAVGDVRTWLAIDGAGDSFRAMGSDGYVCSVGVPLVREIAAGDSLAVYRPAVPGRPAKEVPPVAMAILAVGAVGRVADLGGGARRIEYRPGTYVELAPPIPVAALAGAENPLEGKPKLVQMPVTQARALTAMLAAMAHSPVAAGAVVAEEEGAGR